MPSHCRDYAGPLAVAPASFAKSAEARHTGAAAGVPVVCRSHAEPRQADGSRSDVVMSGAVDSERKSGIGNIDANCRDEQHRSCLTMCKGMFLGARQ